MNPEGLSSIETMPERQLRQLQSERLRKTVKRVYERVEFYRRKMQAAGVKPDDIRTVDDLKYLPFTSKADLRECYPCGAFAVPESEIVRVHVTSGTTGKPIIVGCTENDLKMWAECVERCLRTAGATSNDVIQIAYGYGLFTGGLGLHYGAERLGAMVVPASTGSTARQVSLLEDLGVTVLCCTPSYALYLADYIRDNDIPPQRLKLRIGVFGAEPWSDEIKAEIEKRLGITAYDIYGLSEMAGPGVAVSCGAGDGLHINADNFIPEVVDPETGELLEDGTAGELVFTCVTKEALPLIRYRTRDLTKLTHERCACGRTLPRMSRIIGRSDDMLIIRGVNVFPSQVESVLLSMGLTEPHYMLYVDRRNNLDSLTVEVEMTEKMFSDRVNDVARLEHTLHDGIRAVLNINADVRLVAPRSIPRAEGKSKRVIDRRSLG